MGYHCLHYNDDESQMRKCSIFIEDGYCFNCPCYHSFDGYIPASEETKKKVLKKLIETLNYVMKGETK